MLNVSPNRSDVKYLEQAILREPDIRDVEPTERGIRRHVWLGEKVVTRNLLEEKLSARAYALAKVFWQLCDSSWGDTFHRSETRVLRSTLSSMTGLSMWQLVQAIKELAAFGFLHGEWKINQSIPDGRGGYKHVDWFYLRRVFGGPILGNANEVLVPLWIADRLAKAEPAPRPTWGGARKGAGRPRKGVVNASETDGRAEQPAGVQKPVYRLPVPPRLSWAIDPERAIEIEQILAEEWSGNSSLTADKKHFQFPSISNSNQFFTREESFAFFSSKELRAAEPRGVSDSQGEDEMTQPPTPKKLKISPALGSLLDLDDDPIAPATPAGEGEKRIMVLLAPGEERNEKLGSFLSDEVIVQTRPIYLPSTPIEGVPPFPGSWLAPAQVPNPPKIKEKAGDHDIAAHLVLAYEASVRFFCKQDPPAFKYGNLSQKKIYAALIECGKVLREFDISPHAWCGFSCGVWVKMRGGRVTGALPPPPPRWVFDIKRIGNNCEAFREMEDSYGGGTIKYGPKHKKLISDYDKMRDEINFGSDSSSEIAKKWFPDWEKTVGDVRDEARAIQKQIRKQIDAGEWVWG